jgi:transposase-like protein
MLAYVYPSNTVSNAEGAFELDTPRVCDSIFEPKLINKNQTQLTAMYKKILYLYVAS